VPDAPSADRLSASDLGLFDDNVQLGATDVYIGPGEAYKLFLLGLPYRWVSSLPDPTVPPRYETDDPDYRTQYFTGDQILAFYEALRAQYPSIVTRQQIGVSINNEPIWAYRLYRGTQAPQRHLVTTYLIHAREWVSGSSGLHIGKFITEALHLNETKLAAVLTNFMAVWIVPITNPDGYRYTWTNNRLWRKNRRNNGGSYGVDLNRNFATGWGGQGSSGSPSSDVYHGTAPFSEPETQAVRGLSLGLSGIPGYIDFHSYAEKILYAWSYTTAPSPLRPEMNKLALSMRDRMVRGGGHTYNYGQGSIALYIAGGTTKDWFHQQFGAHAYTIELRDTGTYGFLLPESQIAPTQDEALNALIDMAFTFRG
jgi:murein tripeptide amidase MpaA